MFHYTLSQLVELLIAQEYLPDTPESRLFWMSAYQALPDLRKAHEPLVKPVEHWEIEDGPRPARKAGT